MTWITRTLFAFLATLIGATATGELDPPTPPSAVPAPANALGAVAPLTPEQEALIAATFERFSEAGLEAPTHVVPSFHSSMDACNGNLGLRTTEDGVSRVRVCWSHEDPFVELQLQGQALMHELAHAWANTSLDDHRRAAFVEFVGAASWALAADDWQDRGTEQAADLITWALLDPAVLFIDFDNGECHSWAPAFELLTGVDAPAPLLEACAISAPGA